MVSAALGYQSATKTLPSVQDSGEKKLPSVQTNQCTYYVLVL